MVEQKQENPASPEFFFEAEAVLIQANEALVNASRERWVLNEKARTSRDELKEIEARFITSGEIEGKNEAERKAQLATLLADDPEAIGQRNRISAVEAQLLEVDVYMEQQRSIQSAARYRMRYADATLRYLANIPPESPHESEA